MFFNTKCCQKIFFQKGEKTYWQLLKKEYNELIKKVQEYSKSYKTKELYKQYMDRLESCKYKLKQEKTDYLRWQSKKS